MTIRQTFDELRRRGRMGLLPFIPAGYPSIEALPDLLRGLESGGASAVEIGFPFSDPIADGPVIQEAFTAALKAGLRLADVFKGIAAARKAVSLPLIGMVSYSIVYRQGVDRFARTARASGLDGLIVPDLPPPEADGVCRTVQAAGLDTILLVAPTTSPQRTAEIVRLCSGFVYYLSVSGITGERSALPSDLADHVRRLKGLTDRPVCVGFGISRPEHLAALRGVADGAIVGSAIVRRISQHADRPPEAIGEAVAAYCRELQV